MYPRVGEVIREARLEKGITLRKFAKLVGISPTMLSRIELDEHAARVGEDTLKKIAQHLDVNSDYLLSLANKMDSDLQELIIKKPLIMPDFLRTVGNSSEETLREMMQLAEQRKEPL
ncbi:MAG: helix-turn-helix domain-containing protein [Vampirovibrionales bacterium]